MPTIKKGIPAQNSSSSHDASTQKTPLSKLQKVKMRLMDIRGKPATRIAASAGTNLTNIINSADTTEKGIKNIKGLIETGKSVATQANVAKDVLGVATGLVGVGTKVYGVFTAASGIHKEIQTMKEQMNVLEAMDENGADDNDLSTYTDPNAKPAAKTSDAKDDKKTEEPRPMTRKELAASITEKKIAVATKVFNILALLAQLISAIVDIIRMIVALINRLNASPASA